jgi:hypothetical protein
MPFQSPHAALFPVVRNVQSLGNCQNQQKCGPSGNSQLPPAIEHVSVLAGERYSSQGGSSIATTIQGQHSTPSSLLNISCVADIGERVTSTPSATQGRSLITSTLTPGESCCTTPALSGTIQTDSTCHVVSSPTSSLASTRTPLRGFENLPTSIRNPEARAIITHPLRT